MNECWTDEWMDYKDGGWGSYLILSLAATWIVLWVEKKVERQGYVGDLVWSGLHHSLTSLILDLD